MLFKKPVIAFNCCSNLELITNKKNVFLTVPNDVASFVNKIIILKKNHITQKEFGEKGFAKIISQYDSKNYNRRVFTVYFLFIK